MSAPQSAGRPRSSEAPQCVSARESEANWHKVAGVEDSLQPALLDVILLAALLGLSRSFVRKLHDTGRLPRPVRIGRAVRWRRDEVLAWIETGCPSRDRWEAMGGRRA